MSIWDSVKASAENKSKLNELQKKLRRNEPLSIEERECFEKLAKRTVEEDIAKNPNKYFSATTKYGRLEIDEAKRLFKLGIIEFYSFDELNSYELLENGSSITSGGLGIGRAVVGGILFAGVGAVIGGVTKGRTQTNIVESLKILVTFKNRKPVSTTLNFIKKKQKKDKRYEKILVEAQETLAGFDFITQSLENVRHDELIDSIGSTPSSANSVADEIRKYKDLAEEGIITKEEFEKKKKELLEQ
ncbi:MAG: SHOCT domain-containing protein [Enterococcaceae bacterium]|jgi:hypothetical protein|nr:SHOCT domain-containing protein [Enterococcaceae bacterium]